jgi:hypothetical protein
MKSLAIRVALLAGLGTIATTLPAAAAPAALGGTDVRANEPTLVQLAQLNPRQINEARGGDYAKKKAKKKKKR